MTRILPALVVSLVACLVSGCASSAPTGAVDPKPLRVVSEETAKGFVFPESVAYDPRGKVLYVSEFGSELKPLEKDGKGRISRVSLTGQILDRQFLPGPGGEPLNKPKGIWVQGNRLWVTDIDVVWVFDLTTRRGKKLPLPGAQFANDLAVAGGVLYVSDNRTDQVFRIEPADFLETAAAPRITRAVQGKAMNPNGVYPGRDGALLVVGFLAADQPRGIYSVSAAGEVATLAPSVGRLDGVYRLDDGSLLVTEWNSGSLLRWSPKGTDTLARGFKGPADFCVVPEASGMLVVVPDLVSSELRMVRIAR
jgi:DNA-binding beta-propeller fold protein YncE